MSFNCVKVPEADVKLILLADGGGGSGNVGGHNKYGKDISHFRVSTTKAKFAMRRHALHSL